MKYLIYFLLFICTSFINAQEDPPLPINLKSFETSVFDYEQIKVIIKVESELNVSHYSLLEDDYEHTYISATNSREYKAIIRPNKLKGVLTLKVVDYDGSVSFYYAKYTLPDKNLTYQEYDFVGRLHRTNISPPAFKSGMVYYHPSHTIKFWLLN